MSTNPYSNPPRNEFLLRAMPAAMGVFALGFLLMGLLVSSPEVPKALGRLLGTTSLPEGRVPASSTLLSPPPMLSANPLAAGALHWKQMLGYWVGFPLICWGDNAVNEFQVLQCSEFMDRMVTGSILALIPGLLLALFLARALDRFKGFYRRSRKAVEEGKALFAGRVTEPAEAPNDRFGRMFRLRAISVQLGDKRQINVYFPMSAPVPLPGQLLAIFDGGKHFGVKRYIAALYAPHLAVVAGSR